MKWSARHSWFLAAIVALGLIWRLHVALSAPWYWDEGYVAELARSLASSPFTRPHVGGLWEDGFFPLSTPFFLAPLSAAPFTCLPFCGAMTGVRLWALGLDLLALGVLVLLVRPGERPRLALLVALCYALLPFAAEFGGRAFYHHFAVMLMLACLAMGQDLFMPESGAAGPLQSVPLHAEPRIAAASWCAGFALASCYWLWWLPLGWCLVLAWERPRGWAWCLVWSVLPPLATLTLNVLPDLHGAWWSIQAMLMTSSGSGIHFHFGWLTALRINFLAMTFLVPGIVGLAWAAFRKRGPWPWFLFCLLCAVWEPIRQRGIYAVSAPYPFQLAAPLAALGTAVLLDALWAGRASRLAWPAGIAVLVLFFRPVNLDLLRQLSLDPGAIHQVQGYLEHNAQHGDLVCGMPHLDWTLRPTLRVCDPFDPGAAEGRASGIYVAGAPASRFAYSCRIENIRYAVVSRIHFIGFFRFPGVALTYLEMERAGWRLVFNDHTFKVYENPRFGVIADPSVRILQAPDYYRRAHDQAVQAGRQDLAAFAVTRLESALGPSGRGLPRHAL